jgi:hypothetical protein
MKKVYSKPVLRKLTGAEAMAYLDEGVLPKKAGKGAT